MRWFWIWCALQLFFALAADRAAAAPRVALVIGESAYLNTAKLANPANDAEDVAKALAAAGFKVTLKRDVGKRDFDLALAQFTRDASDAEAALFYFAGHGMQYNGTNYVMPVDAALQDVVSLRYEMVSVDEIKLALDGSPGVKILMLDSCRDNPLADQLARSLAKGGRGVSTVQGLAPAQPTPGMIIVYATQSGQVALDGTSRNSPFAKAFVEELGDPGLEVATLFRNVEQKVLVSTNGRQSPELSISGVPEYFLTELPADRKAWDKVKNSGDAAALRAFLANFPLSVFAAEARAALRSLEAAAAKPEPDNVEITFWQSAEKGGTAADYQAYLQKYPNGQFSTLAGNRIAALTPKPDPGPAVATPPKATPAPPITAPSVAARPVVTSPPEPQTLRKETRPKPRKSIVPSTADSASKVANDAHATAQHSDEVAHGYCAPGYKKVRAPHNGENDIWDCVPE